MITIDDVVICLSNSGNTAELAAVINYSNCRQIPLIGITMNPESFLGRSSNVVLCLPKSAEGCAIGLAPTTSTTAQVALGDALAVAITVDRQFAKSDFNHFHPGGSLGKTTSRVAEIMKSTEACVCVGISTRADEIALLMAQKRVDIAAVVDAQGELIGMLYAKDLSMPNLKKTAEDLMSHEVFAAVSVHASMSDADIIMDAMNVNTLFVLDSEASLAGMVHREA
jgi:arabinose-5-phosphate isomerase